MSMSNVLLPLSTFTSRAELVLSPRSRKSHHETIHARSPSTLLRPPSDQLFCEHSSPGAEGRPPVHHVPIARRSSLRRRARQPPWFTTNAVVRHGASALAIPSTVIRDGFGPCTEHVYASRVRYRLHSGTVWYHRSAFLGDVAWRSQRRSRIRPGATDDRVHHQPRNGGTWRRRSRPVEEIPPLSGG